MSLSLALVVARGLTSASGRHGGPRSRDDITSLDDGGGAAASSWCAIARCPPFPFFPPLVFPQRGKGAAKQTYRVRRSRREEGGGGVVGLIRAR